MFVAFWLRMISFYLISVAITHMERTLHTSKYYRGNFIKRSITLRENLEAHVARTYKFCVVRNPVDWYISYWRFMQDLNWSTRAPQRKRSRFGFKYDSRHPLVPLERFAHIDFNVFVERVTKSDPGFLSRLYASYAPISVIDRVLKQETLVNDLKATFDHLQVQWTESDFLGLGRVNQSKAPAPARSVETVSRIRDTEREATERFGY
jgi:hypothetical protein